MKKQDNYLDDQTDFIQQGPIIEDEEGQWWEESSKSRIKSNEKFFQTRKGKLTLVGLFVLLLIVVLTLITLLIRRTLNNNGEPIFQPNITPTPRPSTLQQQIKDLRLQLKAADPAIKDTPFPQVDMDISIPAED